MKINWEWSVDSEANRLIQACTNVANGFYKLNGFYPLDASSKNYLPQGVYLPKLAYTNIPDFWAKCATTDLGILPAPDKFNMGSQLGEMLRSYNLDEPHSLEKDWQSIESVFWNRLKAIVPPTQIESIQSISAHMSQFGTTGSFNILNGENKHMVIWLRKDATIGNVAEAILTSLLRNELMATHHTKWSESEIVVDWLLHDSNLQGLFNGYLGTLHKVRTNVQAKIPRESSVFLTQIGCPLREQPFALNEGHPHYGGRYIHNLTEREKKLLSVLIERSPTTLSYDELANQIFESDDVFSLSTMSKVMDRLRSKLERNGISKAYIATDRNQGYFLKN